MSDNGLEGKYNGVCRFELNLTSKKQIREALCLTGNTLEEVLNAERNPIQDFLGDVLAEDPAGKAVQESTQHQHTEDDGFVQGNSCGAFRWSLNLDEEEAAGSREMMNFPDQKYSADVA